MRCITGNNPSSQTDLCIFEIVLQIGWGRLGADVEGWGQAEDRLQTSCVELKGHQMSSGLESLTLAGQAFQILAL